MALSANAACCTPAETSEEAMRRIKFHAQRKFAQGMTVPSTVNKDTAKISDTLTANDSSSALSPVKDDVEPVQVLPVKRPNTEDFLTFLCFRRTSILPPSLDFFNNACTYDTEMPSGNEDKASNHVDGNNSISNSPAKQKNISTSSKSVKSTQVKPGGKIKKKSIESRKLAQKVKIKHLKTANANIRLKKWMLKKERKMSSQKKNALKTKKNVVQNKEKAYAKNWKQMKKQIIKKQINKCKNGTKLNASMRKKTLSLRKGLRSSGSFCNIVEVTTVRAKRNEIRSMNKTMLSKQKDVEKKTRQKITQKVKNSLPEDPPPIKKSRLKQNILGSGKAHHSKTTPQQMSSRPSRRTKEAAALFMEMLGKDFRCPNQSKKNKQEDDTLSVESFPELPSAKKNEQIEKEIKEQARKSSETSNQNLKKTLVSLRQKGNKMNRKSQLKVETPLKTCVKKTMVSKKKSKLLKVKKKQKPLGAKNKEMVRKMALKRKTRSQTKKSSKGFVKPRLKVRSASLDNMASDASKLEQNKNSVKRFTPLLTWHETFLKSVAETVKGGRRSTSRMSENADSSASSAVQTKTNEKPSKESTAKTTQKTSDKVKPSSVQEAKNSTSLENKNKSKLITQEAKKGPETPKSKDTGSVEEKNLKAKINPGKELRKIETRRSSDLNLKMTKTCRIGVKSGDAVDLEKSKQSKKKTVTVATNDSFIKTGMLPKTEKAEDGKMESLVSDADHKPVTRKQTLIASAVSVALDDMQSVPVSKLFRKEDANATESKKLKNDNMKVKIFSKSVSPINSKNSESAVNQTETTASNNTVSSIGETIVKLRTDDVRGKKPISLISGKPTLGKKPISKITGKPEVSDSPQEQSIMNSIIERKSVRRSTTGEALVFESPSEKLKSAESDDKLVQKLTKPTSKLFKKKLLKSKVCLRNKNITKKLLKNDLAKNGSLTVSETATMPSTVSKNLKKKDGPKNSFLETPGTSPQQNTPKSVEICTQKSYDDLFNEMAANFNSCLPDTPISTPDELDFSVDVDKNDENFDGKKLFLFEPVLDFKMLATSINEENIFNSTTSNELQSLKEKPDDESGQVISSSSKKTLKLQTSVSKNNTTVGDIMNEEKQTESKNAKSDIEEAKLKIVLTEKQIQKIVNEENKEVKVAKSYETEDSKSEPGGSNEAALSKVSRPRNRNIKKVSAVDKKQTVVTSVISRTRSRRESFEMVKENDLPKSEQILDTTISSFNATVRSRSSSAEKERNKAESQKPVADADKNEKMPASSLNITLRSKRNIADVGNKTVSAKSEKLCDAPCKSSTSMKPAESNSSQTKENSTSVVSSPKSDTSVLDKIQKQPYLLNGSCKPLNQSLKVCIVDVLKGGKKSLAEITLETEKSTKKPCPLSLKGSASNEPSLKSKSSEKINGILEDSWGHLPEAIISIPKIAMDKNAWIAKHANSPKKLIEASNAALSVDKPKQDSVKIEKSLSGKSDPEVQPASTLRKLPDSTLPKQKSVSSDTTCINKKLASSDSVSGKQKPVSSDSVCVKQKSVLSDSTCIRQKPVSSDVMSVKQKPVNKKPVSSDSLSGKQKPVSSNPLFVEQKSVPSDSACIKEKPVSSDAISAKQNPVSSSDSTSVKEKPVFSNSTASNCKPVSLKTVLPDLTSFEQKPASSESTFAKQKPISFVSTAAVKQKPVSLDSTPVKQKVVLSDSTSVKQKPVPLDSTCGKEKSVSADSVSVTLKSTLADSTSAKSKPVSSSSAFVKQKVVLSNPSFSKKKTVFLNSASVKQKAAPSDSVCAKQKTARSNSISVKQKPFSSDSMSVKQEPAPSNSTCAKQKLASPDAAAVKQKPICDEIYDFENEITTPKESYKDFVRTVKKCENASSVSGSPSKPVTESNILDKLPSNNCAGTHLIVPVCVQEILSKTCSRGVKKEQAKLSKKLPEKVISKNLLEINASVLDSEESRSEIVSKRSEEDGAENRPLDIASILETKDVNTNFGKVQARSNMSVTTNEKKLILNVPKLPVNFSPGKINKPDCDKTSSYNGADTKIGEVCNKLTNGSDTNKNPKSNFESSAPSVSSPLLKNESKNHSPRRLKYSETCSSDEKSALSPEKSPKGTTLPQKSPSSPLKSNLSLTKLKSHKLFEFATCKLPNCNSMLLNNQNAEIKSDDEKSKSFKRDNSQVNPQSNKCPKGSSSPDNVSKNGASPSREMSLQSTSKSNASKLRSLSSELAAKSNLEIASKDITKSQMNKLVSERTKKLIIESANANGMESSNTRRVSTEKRSSSEYDLTVPSKKIKASTECKTDTLKPISFLASSPPGNTEGSALETSSGSQQPAAVQVSLEKEAVIECSTQADLEEEEESGGQLFYIPLQQPSSDSSPIQGVALKLDTEGPDKRVIMRAKLVTKPPSKFSKQTASVASGTVGLNLNAALLNSENTFLSLQELKTML